MIKLPKSRKKSYSINLIGICIIFIAIYLIFESGLLGSQTSYIKGVCTTICYTIIMVCSLNLLTGYMGEFSIGHAGFMSVGAYASAIFTNAIADKGISSIMLFIIALIIGGLAAALAGLIVGIPALRLRGDYLAIVTLAFSEIIRVAFCNFDITGGGKTMSGITKLSDFYWCFWVMIICVAIMYMYIRSRFGRTVTSIRDNTIAAEACGINVTFYKVLTFTISAFFAGVSGAIYAHYMTAMIPTNFDYTYSTEFLSAVIIGGSGSLTGSILGGSIFCLLREAMRQFATYRMLIYSIVLILIMIFRPKGILGKYEFSLTNVLKKISPKKSYTGRITDE